MPSDPIPHEDRIVWTEDIHHLDYVREVVTPTARTRHRPIPWHGPGRRVGYSTLTKTAPNNGSPGWFTRRLFWINDHDRSEDPTGVYTTGCPIEAVDPRTVAPGVPGQQTDRAWGAPLPRSLRTPRDTDQPPPEAA